MGGVLAPCAGERGEFSAKLSRKKRMYSCICTALTLPLHLSLLSKHTLPSIPTYTPPALPLFFTKAASAVPGKGVETQEEKGEGDE